MSRSKEVIQVRKLDSPDLDANQMLQMDGIYRLTDVCRYLFFTPDQIRYQAKRCSDSRNVMGVFRFEPRGTYLVDMPIFSKWIAELWLGPKN